MRTAAPAIVVIARHSRQIGKFVRIKALARIAKPIGIAVNSTSHGASSWTKIIDQPCQMAQVFFFAARKQGV
jgi:hypothetical protein